jgi:serine protease Do
VPGLGVRVAFITPQQSQSMSGMMPPGALVVEAQSGGVAAKAGIKANDIIEAIGSHKIDTRDDLRAAFRELGPGKTPFTIRRPDGPKTILVDCPNC